MSTATYSGDPELSLLLGLVRQAQNLVVFTGAGMSTESGIPDYRSPGGMWTKVEPPTLPEFLSGPQGRQRYWEYYREFFPVFQKAQPNAGHLALGRLYAAGRLQGVVTQNIDGLHQAGGVPAERVWELHGSAYTSVCLSCGRHEVKTELVLGEYIKRGEVPACPLCGGPIKPRTISFGQSLDQRVLSEAAQMCAQADLLLVVGSSLVVTPAADLPRLTLDSGGRLAIVNRQPTGLDRQASVVLARPAGEVLSWIADQAK